MGLAFSLRWSIVQAMIEDFDPSAVQVREVEVRPVRADERRRWDALMDPHHIPRIQAVRGPWPAAGRGLAGPLAGTAGLAVGSIPVWSA